MAICTITTTHSLDEGLILAPERYHPGRNLKFNEEVEYELISELVKINLHGSITPGKLFESTKKAYVVDTGDVEEGRIKGNKVFKEEIKSQKKIFKPGDIIISRLRPYLRQIAFVDQKLSNINNSEYLYICSTEFYVLSPKDGQSIAFLVPLLLSESVQQVFAKAVEGGQHPRFSLETLLSIKIPLSILNKRNQISEKTEDAINSFRNYENKIEESILEINKNLNLAFI